MGAMGNRMPHLGQKIPYGMPQLVGTICSSSSVIFTESAHWFKLSGKKLKIGYTRESFDKGRHNCVLLVLNSDIVEGKRRHIICDAL